MESLKQMLLIFLEGKYRPIHSGEIERFAASQGYKASNGGRRMRELVNEGKVKPVYELNKNTGHREVWYIKV